MKKKIYHVMSIFFLIILAGCKEDSSDKPQPEKPFKEEKVMLINGKEISLDEDLIKMSEGCGAGLPSTTDYTPQKQDAYKLTYTIDGHVHHFSINVREDSIITSSRVEGAKCIPSTQHIDKEQHPDIYQKFIDLLEPYGDYKKEVDVPTEEEKASKSAS